MIGVITGDIVASHKMGDRKLWLNKLKEIFNTLKRDNLYSNVQWEIFRGDSFQLRIEDPSRTLLITLIIRSGMKAIEEFDELGMDVRAAIGIGNEDYTGNTISEADGSAYRNSGQLLDKTKNRSRMVLHSPWKELDEEMRVSLALADVLITGWTNKSAEIAWWFFNGTSTQEKLSRLLNISQPAVHKRMQRANIEEIDLLEKRFRKQVLKFTSEYGTS